MSDLLADVLKQFVVDDVVVLKRRRKVGDDRKRNLKH